MEQPVEYEVVCMSCGTEWSPPENSPLWQRAKEACTEGIAYPLRITPDECPCEGREDLQPRGL